MNSNLARSIVCVGALLTLTAPAAAADADCQTRASPACYTGFEPAGSGGHMNYYASATPAGAASARAPVSALIALHGHPRDAGKTFDAALRAVQRAQASAETLVIAPVFQVDASRASRCSSAGVPAAAPGDLLWTCESWIEGGRAGNGDRLTSFAAMDALVVELTRQWPSLRTITIAGFSAGAQMVQHYIGFAATGTAMAPAAATATATAPATPTPTPTPEPSPSPTSVTLRYVVADPGTWLYFDAARPEPVAPGCDAVNRWKYGTDDLPDTLGRSAAIARAQYAQADVRYLGGELDSSAAPGTYYKILDKSCAAMAQGPYRLQRGQAYAEYDRRLLAPEKQRQLTVVPGCAHDVACVFPAPAARAALFGPVR